MLKNNTKIFLFIARGHFWGKTISTADRALEGAAHSSSLLTRLHYGEELFQYTDHFSIFLLDAGDLGRVSSAWEDFGGASAPTSQICAVPRCFCCSEKSQAEIQFPVKSAFKAPHQDLHFTVELRTKRR